LLSVYGIFGDCNKYNILSTAETTSIECQLEYLSKSDDINIRFHVARNPYVSQGVLEKLSFDDSFEVREAVAMHKNISNETIFRLSCDKHVGPRCEIAKNVITPIDIVARMLDDCALCVRMAAANNLKTHE
jgi:hypothetical protein